MKTATDTRPGSATTLRQPVSPRRATARTITPARRPHRVPRRIGSEQVVSVRGRRVPVRRANPQAVRFAVSLIGLLVGGIFAVLWLSGTTTQQSFQIKGLQSQATQLDNQLEALTRDVQAATSTAEITRRAAALGMVIADQPGVIQVDDHGVATVVREPDTTKTRPLVDINGARIRTATPSTDPGATAALGAKPPVPVHAAPRGSNLPAVAPYAPNIRSHGAGGADE